MLTSFEKRLGSLVIVSVIFFAPLANSDTKPEGYQKLQEVYQQFNTSIEDTPFDEPIHIISSYKNEKATGEIYALINNSFSNVSAHLVNSKQWCDMLALHVNVKGCYENKNAILDKSTDSAIALFVGRNFYQPIEDAHAMRYILSVDQKTDDYLHTTLSSKEGPFGTSEYKLVFEAIPLTDKTTFIHFKYSYHYGFLARMALSGYLATIGRKKVGFTIDKYDEDNNPVYVKGMQGIVERNSMRYFIAIRAYLDSYALKKETWNSRIEKWYELALPYKRQLLEVNDRKYLLTKQEEYKKRVSLETALLIESEGAQPDSAW